MDQEVDLTRTETALPVFLTDDEFGSLMYSIIMERVPTEVMWNTYIYKELRFGIIYFNDGYEIEII